ncbi:hypothetical protein [Streptomyces sp. NPDC102264]|uniref:DUF6414 family protein n=1 Tax=Streptomyces sp. NPDC102264 TaxID=3366149 RepID=UPI003816C038
MLAQLDGGIAEESRETERKEKRTTVGPRVAGQYFQGSGSETYTNKSLGDALFPMLEQALESELLLRDISQEVLINSRLQEGRQYLDSEADILFARYGTERQEWTIVGSVGSYGTEETALPDMDFYNPDGSVNRAEFAESMNAQMRNLGRLGFIDLPQHPGFSLIPFAVYRSIPRSGAVALTE